ncbi:MAG: hypothetical protein QM763_05375 [Agriterribacter sp.]
MPVYWFALSQLVEINMVHTIAIFIILHLLVYPASNGYNSYMDRDTESIGGIEKPLPPTRQLYYVTIVLDSIAIIASFFISIYFVLGISGYILASKAYSYRGIRLKKYPLLCKASSLCIPVVSPLATSTNLLVHQPFKILLHRFHKARKCGQISIP